MSKELTKDEIEELEINEQGQRAIDRGECVDLLGEPMSKDDFIEIDPRWSTDEVVLNVVIPQVKHLMGKVLTIIDATTEDKERGKYVKDLIKDAFSDEAANIFNLVTQNGFGKEEE